MKRKTKRTLLSLAGILLTLYALLGFLLIPWIVRSQILKRLPGIINHEVRLKDVRFNPFTLTGQLDELQILDKEGQSVVSLRNFKGNIQISSLFLRSLRFKEIALLEPSLQIRKNADSSFNFEEFIPESSAEESVGEQKDKAMPVVTVEHFHIQNGKVGFLDQSLKSNYRKEIRNITFSVDGLTTEPGGIGQHAFIAASETAELFSWTGSVGLNPLNLDGHISVKELELPNFMPFIESLINAKVQGGRLSVELDYALRLVDDSPSLVIENGDLSLNAFSLRTPDASEDLVAWNSLNVAKFSMDLISRQLRVHSIELAGTNVLAHRHTDGSFNLTRAIRLAERPATVDSDIDSSTGDSWQFIIDDLHISGTSLHMRDETPASPLDLTLTLPSVRLLAFSNERNQPFSVRLALSGPSEGFVAIDGEACLQPSRGMFQIEMGKWDMTLLNPYLHEFTNMDLLEGRFGLNGSLVLGAENSSPDNLSFNGGVEFSGFSARESTVESPMTSWSRLAIKGIQFNYPAGRLQIASIDWLNPQQEIVISENGAINIPQLAKTGDLEDANGQDTGYPENDPSPATTAETPPIQFAVDTVSIHNGSFIFKDRQQSPEVFFSAEEITSSVQGLSSDPSARPALTFTSQLMGLSTLAVEGELNPLSSQPYASLQVNLKGLGMDPFAPYFARYVGYQLEKGTLNLDLNYKLEEQKLIAENQVELNQLTLGESTESTEATSLPVSLAMNLLKDPSGNIQLDVPIRGDLNDPEFQLGSVILKTLSNLVLKVASSPFNMLAKLVNISADDLQSISFKRGRSELTEQSLTHLEALSKAMKERPGIRLEISVTIDPEVEIPALEKILLQTELKRAYPADPAQNLSDDEQYQQRVERAYRRERRLIDSFQELPPFQEMESALIEKIQVTDNDLNQLSIQRKQSIFNYLVKHQSIAPERIETGGDQAHATSASGLSVAQLSIK